LDEVICPLCELTVIELDVDERRELAREPFELLGLELEGEGGVVAASSCSGVR